MRGGLAALARACALGAGLFFALAAPASALTAVEARDAALDQANAANALAVTIRAALNPERCLGADQALEAIQGATAGARIQIIASALEIVGADRWWCDSVRTAIATADQAAQLALATNVGVTGGTGTNTETHSVTIYGTVGAPGGGGGSGYVP